jgi:CheY-like chemotaxis protein
MNEPISDICASSGFANILILKEVLTGLMIGKRHFTGVSVQIVLVDPSRTVRRIVCDLIQHGDYQVRSLSDGDEALAYIKANPEVRALITSAELASMSGIDLCRQARALAGSRRPLYILLMSRATNTIDWFRLWTMVLMILFASHRLLRSCVPDSEQPTA